MSAMPEPTTRGWRKQAYLASCRRRLRLQGECGTLRAELASLRARHDSGAVPPATYAVIVALEREIAWHEHVLEVAP